MRTVDLKKITYSAVCLVLAIVLPFFTMQSQTLGKIFNPMHFSVIICGFISGPFYGGIIGVISPLLRSLLFGMPPIFPNAVGMAVELFCYGLFSGLFYKIFPKKFLFIYPSLIISMIIGRGVWGLTSYFLYSLSGTAFTFKMFITSAFITSGIGILAQILIIPPVVGLLLRHGIIKER